MNEDSFLDSFMEGHIGGWTGDEDELYASDEQYDDYHCDNYPPDDSDEDEDSFDENEYDGQPDEYTEWQDVYGGDDWDHGQYDNDY